MRLRFSCQHVISEMVRNTLESRTTFWVVIGQTQLDMSNATRSHSTRLDGPFSNSPFAADSLAPCAIAKLPLDKSVEGVVLQNETEIAKLS